MTEADIALLAENKIPYVMAAILETGDISENDAASQIATFISGTNIKAAVAFTGRVNLYAEDAGLVVISTDDVNQLNHIDEAITLATVPQNSIVQKGQLLATVKIIPFGVGVDVIERVMTDLEVGLISVTPFHPYKASLIQTILPGTNDKIFDKALKVTAQRLATFGSKLDHEVRCPHDITALEETLKQAVESANEMILIMGASAITDRRDVIPAAIEQAGGEVIHYGMPVDPGNLMLLAKLNGKWVLGLPGCSRSPKLNGIDLILSRISAGQDVSTYDIMDMGVGGLLSEYAGRPQPREKAEALGMKGKNSAPKIAALVLAAGQSKRMGTENKLLLPYKDKVILSHVFDEIKNAGIDDIIAVTGHQREEVEKQAKMHNVTVCHNDLYADGMSTSVKLGVKSLPSDCDAVIIILGDMPTISSEIIQQIISAYSPSEDKTIIIPTHQGKRGNPILWDRSYFPEFDRLEGDMGAKLLLKDFKDDICELDVGSDAIFLDIDTLDVYHRLKSS